VTKVRPMTIRQLMLTVMMRSVEVGVSVQYSVQKSKGFLALTS